MMSLELAIWSAFAGIVIGAVGSIYNKRMVGGFIRALIKSGATSEYTAATVEELGYAKNYFILMSLRSGSVLRKYVNCENEGKLIPAGEVNVLRRFFSFTGEFREKTDFAAAKFFIPDNMIDKAEIRYSKRGTDLFSLLLTILVFLIVVYLSIKFIPPIASALQDVFTRASEEITSMVQ
jgi:hypothetical protein